MMINLTNTVPTMHVDVSTQKQDNEPLINMDRKIDKIEQDIQSLKSVALQPRLTEPNIPTNKSLPNQSENQKSIQKHNESENKFTYSVPIFNRFNTVLVNCAVNFRHKKIYLNKPCQYRNTDHWADDTSGTNSQMILPGTNSQMILPGTNSHLEEVSTGTVIKT